MNITEQSINAQSLSLAQTLSASVSTLPSQTSAWQSVLQSAYTAYTPNLADFTQAIYSVWLNRSVVANSITYTQLANGLLGIVDNHGNQVFSQNLVYPAVNVYYMMVTINFDTVQILATNPQPAPNVTWLNSGISMSDNHPSTDTGGGGFELNDEGLTANMTICWTPVANDGTTVITLTQFFQNNASNWTSLASQPVPLSGGQSWISIANPNLPTETSAVYSFYLTIAGSNALFAFDPFIGDDDES